MKSLSFGWIRMVVVLSSVLTLSPAWGQISTLEGNWNLSTDVEGGTQSTVVINSLGIVSFSETFPNEYDGQEYIFDAEHTGKFVMNEENQLVYAGTADGVARDSDGQITVKLVVTGTGILSSDGNMIVGVWVNKETYTTPEGELLDEDGRSYILLREGYEPETPGAELAGDWGIHIQGENIDWTGEATLNPDGSMVGEYVPEGTQQAAALALAGIFSYSDTKEFEFTYTTEPVEIPVVGEATLTISGSGQGNEDNTYISGIWSFTVDVTDRISQTFEGTFEMTKLEESGVSKWDLLK